MSRLLNGDLYLLSLRKEDDWRRATVRGSSEQFIVVYLFVSFCLEWFGKYGVLVILHIPTNYNDTNTDKEKYPKIKKTYPAINNTK